MKIVVRGKGEGNKLVIHLGEISEVVHYPLTTDAALAYIYTHKHFLQ